ncbi:MAG: hypothetical protein PVF17_08280 [Ignavibacteria bacterium]|jgi:hypothetical protein
MEIWISKFLGPVIFALAIPMIFAPNSLNEVTKRFLEDKPLILISGILAMTAGLSIINSYNVWRMDWTLIITLFGWALIIGGASRIITPHFVSRVGSKMMDQPKFTVIIGIFWLVIGGFLIFKGYV